MQTWDRIAYVIFEKTLTGVGIKLSLKSHYEFTNENGDQFVFHRHRDWINVFIIVSKNHTQNSV